MWGTWADGNTDGHAEVLAGGFGCIRYDCADADSVAGLVDLYSGLGWSKPNPQLGTLIWLSGVNHCADLFQLLTSATTDLPTTQ